MIQRYKAIIEYDGTSFSGWQRQNDVLTGQEILETALYDFCQQNITVHCSGRTDAGVHARGQVVHFDLAAPINIRNIQHGVNFHLQNKPLAIINIEETHPDFNARFDAKKRYYCYHIINRESPLKLDINRAWVVHRPLNVEKMQSAAQLLTGLHDFTTFRATACQAKSPLKTIDAIEFSSNGDALYMQIEALSFLHHMVRNIIGSLVLVGEGKWNETELHSALEAKNRTAGGPTAPACGLYFMHVDY